MEIDVPAIWSTLSLRDPSVSQRLLSSPIPLREKARKQWKYLFRTVRKSTWSVWANFRHTTSRVTSKTSARRRWWTSLYDHRREYPHLLSIFSRYESSPSITDSRNHDRERERERNGDARKASSSHFRKREVQDDRDRQRNSRRISGISFTSHTAASSLPALTEPVVAKVTTG